MIKHKWTFIIVLGVLGGLTSVAGASDAGVIYRPMDKGLLGRLSLIERSLRVVGYTRDASAETELLWWIGDDRLFCLQWEDHAPALVLREWLLDEPERAGAVCLAQAQGDSVESLFFLGPSRISAIRMDRLQPTLVPERLDVGSQWEPFGVDHKRQIVWPFVVRSKPSEGDLLLIPIGHTSLRALRLQAEGRCMFLPSFEVLKHARSRYRTLSDTPVLGASYKSLEGYARFDWWQLSLFQEAPEARPLLWFRKGQRALIYDFTDSSASPGEIQIPSPSDHWLPCDLDGDGRLELITIDTSLDLTTASISDVINPHAKISIFRFKENAPGELEQVHQFNRRDWSPYLDIVPAAADTPPCLMVLNISAPQHAGKEAIADWLLSDELTIQVVLIALGSEDPRIYTEDVKISLSKQEQRNPLFWSELAHRRIILTRLTNEGPRYVGILEKANMVRFGTITFERIDSAPSIQWSTFKVTPSDSFMVVPGRTGECVVLQDANGSVTGILTAQRDNAL